MDFLNFIAEAPKKTAPTFDEFRALNQILFDHSSVLDAEADKFLSVFECFGRRNVWQDIPKVQQIVSQPPLFPPAYLQALGDTLTNCNSLATETKNTSQQRVAHFQTLQTRRELGKVGHDDELAMLKKEISAEQQRQVQALLDQHQINLQQIRAKYAIGNEQAENKQEEKVDDIKTENIS
eukprot:TRINITY_DN10689_c0_g1_i2.p1 TRINITY_DN10689_c0_g1~~TRINITY_DN10689_c0_g1_i2.p1  ORF type:complete len:180 (+),score=27.23 TRINITY_DN10689_c0_g1_i2:62-601(+)